MGNWACSGLLFYLLYTIHDLDPFPFTVKSIWATMEPQFVRHVAFGLVIWATMLPSRSTGLRSCSFPAIFNFGDSNSDTGGLSAAFGQAPYPNGETFFRTPSGRYSDGRLIIDFIGILQLQSLLPLLISPPFIMLVVSHQRFLFENNITKAADP